MLATLSLPDVRSGWRRVPCGSLVTVGRVLPNDVIFPCDPKVSRNHALIRVMGDGRYYLVDLGSSNGTSVNGKRMTVPYALTNGDTITCGDSTFTFECQAEAVVESAPKAGTTDQTLLTAGTRIQQMTIVVVDVRNFTLLSERLSHEMLAVIMGKFFRDATAQIEKNRGVVDKFIGDAIMARWLADNDALLTTVTAALTAVQGIRGVAAALNREHRALMDAFSVGCGINSGQAILGNVGAGGMREYTALGDSVNVAFRLETASKELKKDVVIGPDSYRLLPKHLWQDSLQLVSVKNKKDPISVWPVTFAELDKMLPLV